MYKNLLFDFDGTISDTSRGIKNAAKYALTKLNIDYSNIDFSEFIGPTLQDTFRTLFGLNDEKILEAIKLFREYYRKTGLFESEIYDGIDTVLKELHDNGFKLFVASTKPTEFINILLEKYELLNLFTYISGSPSEGNGIPKEKVIETVINKYKLDLTKTIMIGDRKHDIIGAKYNKINSIGVEYGLGTLKELKECNPEFIVSIPKDLIKIIFEKEI